KVAIAGKGPDLEKISALILQNDLSENIALLGYIPDSDLEGFFNRGKVFIVTSESEGFPRTILQAGACGAAIVSSNVGDIGAIVENGFNGLLVDDYTDVHRFAECVLSLLNDDVMRDRLATNIRHTVLSQYGTSSGSEVWSRIIQFTSTSR
ncbi:MAG: glycosyltransferase, partial [Candidatus Cloacimonetes bacterium]|nr:glycosyltransferase [Candidatus Cloacimonadota bacterium]